MHSSYACRAIIFFVYIFPAHYYISTYVVFVCFCVIYSFITAVCYYFRFLFLFSTILLSHIKVLYAFVFYPVVREYPRRNERKMSIGGGRFIFTPALGAAPCLCRSTLSAALMFPFWRRHFAHNGRKRRNRLNTRGGNFHGLKLK